MHTAQDDRLAKARHKRNAMASQLLLRKLRQFHYEYAPYAVKSRFLPAPIMRAALVPTPPRPRLKLRTDPRPHRPLSFKAVLKQADMVRSIPMRIIVAVVARYYDVPVLDLVRSPKYDAAKPRQIVFYLAREIHGFSSSEIGRRLDRDRTTAWHGYQAVADRISVDPVFAIQIETLKAQVLEHCARAMVAA